MAAYKRGVEGTFSDIEFLLWFSIKSCPYNNGQARIFVYSFSLFAGHGGNSRRHDVHAFAILPNLAYFQKQLGMRGVGLCSSSLVDRAACLQRL